MHRFGGMLQGKVAFEADRKTAELKEEEMVIKSFEWIKTASCSQLDTVAYEESLAPWAEQLAAVCVRPESEESTPAVPARMIGLNEKDYNERDMWKLFCHPVVGADEAFSLLKTALLSEKFPAIHHILESDMAKDLRELTELGLAERFKWIMQNIGEIRRDMMACKRQKQQFHFQDVFLAKLAEEKQKTTQLRSLTASLKQVQPINDAAPKLS